MGIIRIGWAWRVEFTTEELQLRRMNSNLGFKRPPSLLSSEGLHGEGGGAREPKDFFRAAAAAETPDSENADPGIFLESAAEGPCCVFDVGREGNLIGICYSIKTDESLFEGSEDQFSICSDQSSGRGSGGGGRTWTRAVHGYRGGWRKKAAKNDEMRRWNNANAARKYNRPFILVPDSGQSHIRRTINNVPLLLPRPPNCSSSSYVPTTPKGGG